MVQNDICDICMILQRSLNRSGVFSGGADYVVHSCAVGMESICAAGIFHMKKQSVLLVCNRKQDLRRCLPFGGGCYGIIQKVSQYGNGIGEGKGKTLGDGEPGDAADALFTHF